MTYEEIVKRYEDFISLRKKGFTHKKIGEKYGITHQAVSNRIKRGFPKNTGEAKMVSNGETMIPLYKEGKGRTRELVRIRDNFTCQDCGLVRTTAEVDRFNKSLPSLKGRIKSLDVHHLNGLCGKMTHKYDKQQDISGLITLCHKCHYNRPEHKVRSKSYSRNQKKRWREWRKRKITKTTTPN